MAKIDDIIANMTALCDGAIADARGAENDKVRAYRSALAVERQHMAMLVDIINGLRGSEAEQNRQIAALERQIESLTSLMRIHGVEIGQQPTIN